MKLAIQIVLWAIALASLIMFEISESASWSHGWLILAFGLIFLDIMLLVSKQVVRILSMIAQAAGRVGNGTDQAQLEKDLELADRRARQMKQAAYSFIFFPVLFFGVAIFGRWIHASDKKIFRSEVISIYFLHSAILFFFLYQLHRRLIALCRQLAQPANEEESTGSK